MKIYQDAERMIKDVYLSETFDFGCKFDAKKVIEDKLVDDASKKDVEYYGKKNGVIHVSSLTRCLRGVVHEMLGHKEDEGTEDSGRQLGIFKAGNLFEDFVVEGLGDRVISRQTEYKYQYKNITLVGRDDGEFIFDTEGNTRLLECKSVHSDSFWHKNKEGMLAAYQNQVQIQTYMWLRRELFNDKKDGYLVYISKDDCTIVGIPVKYNPRIIEECVKPVLDLLSEAYEKEDPMLAPTPEMVVYKEDRRQFQKNWLCTYCKYHNQCESPEWVLNATKEVSRRNLEKKVKDTMSVEQKKDTE